MRRSAQAVLLGTLLSAFGAAQTTQGLIIGRITDALTRRGIPATVHCQNLATHAVVTVHTDSRGLYTLPLLPPALYRLHIEAPRYQGAERYGLDLPVAGFLQQNFALRSAGEIWSDTQYSLPALPGKHRVVTAYGPDLGAVETAIQPAFSRESGAKSELEPSLSYVIGGEWIDALPLAGRDAYALLALLPGVSSDTSTSRGLGLTVAGQRPSASNFLLDGLENNNYVTTGPLVPLAPESIQEYRISTANFSAEYGRTSGFLANVVTRSGGNRFHGVAYFNLGNSRLNANGFQQNAHSFSRPSDHEAQPGFSASGPLRHDVGFFSLSADFDRFRSELDPAPYNMPTTALLAKMLPGTSLQALLEAFPPPVAASGGEPVVALTLRPPSSSDRVTTLPRLDWQLSGNSHLMFRTLAALQRRPDFDWNPYPGFTTPLQDTTIAPGGAFTYTFSTHTTSETRAGYSFDDTGFDRRNNQVPALAVNNSAVTLPGSLLSYSYRNRSGTAELVENWTTSSDWQTVKFGGAYLDRRIYGYLAPLAGGRFTFPSSLNSIEASAPSSYVTMENLQGAPGVAPDYRRNYGYRQFSFYGQDSIRPTRRLVIELGMRYENFGAPANTGSIKDALIDQGSGNRATIVAAPAFLPPVSGRERLYDPDNRDLAVRTGASLTLTDDGRTLIHGGYGIFYDKPFDNEWETLSNNDIVFTTALNVVGADVRAAPAQLLPKYSFISSSGFPETIFFQPRLPNGRIQEAFAGVVQRVSRAFTAEWSVAGTSGARLLTNDQVNRQAAQTTAAPLLNYRAAQGSSRYAAMTATARYRSSHLLAVASYTWSHSIDNQSEPLLGDFFNLESIGPANAQPNAAVSSFIAQQQPAADRASSDFDQRQNLMLMGMWQFPATVASPFWRAVTSDWRVASLAAIRAGLPYSVTATQSLSLFKNNSANLVQPQLALASLPPPGAPGGVQILNPKAFRIPGSTERGNLGRNAWTGPGFYSADLSLSRSFRLPRLPDGWRLTVRADALNVLNHANLGNPCGYFGSPTFSGGCPGAPFGEALYGRRDRNPGYPEITPLDESPRQIQILIRLSW